jgi:hypothetical protein
MKSDPVKHSKSAYLKNDHDKHNYYTVKQVSACQFLSKLFTAHYPGTHREKRHACSGGQCQGECQVSPELNEKNALLR